MSDLPAEVDDASTPETEIKEQDATILNHSDEEVEEPKGGTEEDVGDVDAVDDVGVDDDLMERIQSVSLSNGTLSCAFRDFDSFPPTLAERYGSLTKRLDLSHNCLNAVDHIEKFTALEELILDNNAIEMLSLPQPLPRLHTLSLNKNEISNIDTLLATLREATPNLTYLSLLGNLACPNELVEKEEKDYQRYRYLVLHHIPSLKFLDSRKVTEEEASMAAKQGQYMKAVVMNLDDLEEQQRNHNQTHSESQYSPLPGENEQDFSQHKGSVGRCKYVYYGRHSEGNRFIRNNDL
eukprot:m.125821 g.125821  ORF g.125821 m.125821 type:complete len:294 (-) comp9433_c4_seq1:1649-2530(-)